MKIEARGNPNYMATVVEITNLFNLPKSDFIQGTLIFGNQVIVGKETKLGDVGLFFPVETQLSDGFVSFNNLYRDQQLNLDPSAKPGFFEPHRRIKAVKMRGNKSEGFFIPIESISTFVENDDISEIDRKYVGVSFDTIDDAEICRKYELPVSINNGQGKGRDKTLPRAEDKIIPGQFHFHIDTENLRRNIHKISPDSWISLSEKWHGTSVIVGNLLTVTPKTWLQRLLGRFLPQPAPSYGLVWSSRRVVKGVDVPKVGSNHFYGSEDIWGIVAKELNELRAVEKGITIYAEIVGYTPSGSPIQGGYTYGCAPGNHRTLVYRITSTNEDGKVIEFSWQQIKEYTAKYGLEMVKELWFGQASNFGIESEDFLRDQESIAEWQQDLLETLESRFVQDQDDPHNPGLPAEGIVLKVDHLDHDEAYKLKNFRFLEHETKSLDKGESNIEDQQSNEGDSDDK